MARKFTWATDAMWVLVQWVAGVLPLVLGLLVLVSGDGRWSAPSWHTLMVWGPHEFWGISLLVAGCLALTGRTWLATVGFSLAASWFWLWAASFVVNAAVIPDTSLTGIPMYGAAALVFTGFAVASYMDRD